MSDESNDVSGEDGDEAADDMDRLTDALFNCVSEFAEDEDVPDEVLSAMLLQLSLSLRMMTYATSAAKPSGGGLKLDLDRFGRDAEDIVRAAKKDADRFIATAKAEIAAAELEENDDEA